MTRGDVLGNREASNTSISLLQRVKAQDPAAWERLVNLYTPLVCWWCRRAGLDGQAVEDVGQEVFCAVWRKVVDFRHDREGATFRGWLRTITRHKVIDRARREPPRGVGGSDFQARLDQLPGSASETTDAAAEARLLARRAADLVRAEFPEAKWQAFQRVVLEGQRPADVARDLNVSLNTVYLAKSRVLRRLREEFAGLGEAEFL